MTTNLQTLTTPSRLDDHRYRWDVPDGWQQGRAAFGGLVVGTLVRAGEMHVDDAAMPLRSMTAHLCGPVQPGEAIIAASTLRSGNNTRVVELRIEQAGEIQSHAVLLFGKARSTDCDNAPVAPTLGDWREIPVAPVEPPLGPVFASHFEYRVVEGIPLSGEEEAVSVGWIRPKAPGDERGPAYLASCIDAWWPAAMARLESPRPFGTVTFTFEVLGDLTGLDPNAPLLHSGRQIAGRDGYLVEFRELRGEDGRLLAMNQQTMALIR